MALICFVALLSKPFIPGNSIDHTLECQTLLKISTIPARPREFIPRALSHLTDFFKKFKFMGLMFSGLFSRIPLLKLRWRVILAQSGFEPSRSKMRGVRKAVFHNIRYRA
jgi:hypothetical protein